MGKDWLFKSDNTICNFRSAGVLIRGGKLLVQRERDGFEYAIPGGHVNIGETAETAVIREYKEETGADVVCDRLLWVEETFWKWGDRDCHTIAFYFLISLSGECGALNTEEFFSQKDNCDVQLMWIDIGELKNVVIYPKCAAEKLADISENIEHFVSRD